ncbi:MAG: class I SAM-dependent methyltransferase [Nanoarchaeota archaeon]
MRIYDNSRLYPVWRDALTRGQSIEKEAIFLSRLLKQQGVRTVLDLGGGCGTHARLLQDEGFDVTVLDASKEALDAAMRKGLTTIHCRFEEIHLEKRYDSAMSIWTTFPPYVSDPEGQKRVFSHLSGIVDKMMIFDQSNFAMLPECIDETYSGMQDNHELTVRRKGTFDGKVRRLRYEHRYLDRCSMIEQEWHDDEVIRYCSVEDQASFLGPIWRCVGKYGDFDGAAYEEGSSDRLISVWGRT